MQIRQAWMLAALGTLAVGMPAVAEQSESEMTVEEIVVVEAPITIRHESSRAAEPVVRTEIVELSRQVGFADLDLTKLADVTKLRDRVAAIAEEACKQLDEMFPMPPRDARELQRCIEQAVESAEEDLQAAIAAAD